MSEWLTLRQAAARTGLSVRTLERRIRAGALQSRMAMHGQRPQREVWSADLPQPPTPPPHASLTTPTTGPTLAEAWAQLGDVVTERVKAELSTLRAQVERQNELLEKLAEKRPWWKWRQ